MNNEKLMRFNKIYPWYCGLSSDLLFWIAIDTIFLTVVKGFSASQIVSLTSISLIICICLQVPLLKIIKIIGNTNSVRLSSFLLLVSSILLTGGKNYLVIVIGKVAYEIAYTFHNMTSAILKNNLELQNRSDDYIKIKTKSNTIYAVVTMLISFIASMMFNINSYLPMICCILVCFICFILSFYIVDFSKYNKVKKIDKKKTKVKLNKIIIILIISYGLFYPIVNSGQSNGKLFIQQELMESFSVDETVLIIGAILCVSRIVRVISNLMFNKVYYKYRDKVGIILSILLATSLLFMIIGNCININIMLKIIIMSIGYIIILFVRDPFKVYSQNLALDNIDKKHQQTILTTLALSRKIMRAIMSLSFSLILIHSPIITVITILLVFAIIQILVSIKLYKLVINSKEEVDG